jgi:NAD(P)-dependent dehydrogenase (short-subunit alcohol dehydrogenase family)
VVKSSLCLEVYYIATFYEQDLMYSTGTAGLGSESIRALAAHNPTHIYFTGRNVSAANILTNEVKARHPDVGLTFIPMDLSSLRSVKDAVTKNFNHDHLDILMNNAGIMAKPPSLSVDGYEIQFATNHLGHAMLTKQLLPYLLKATEAPGSDVRIVSNTSDGYELSRAVQGGISFKELESGSTMDRWVLGKWQRYGQSKLANILFTAELARRYPQLKSIVIHPGVVETPLLTDLAGFDKYFTRWTCKLQGTPIVEPHEGAYNQLWCAAGAKKEELRNGGFYRPIGRDDTDILKGEGANAELAQRLWVWTEEILAKFS